MSLACALDGGASSPLVPLAVLPILNAGLALRVGSVVVCGVAATGELAVLLAAGGRAGGPGGVPVPELALVLGGLLLAIAYAVGRERLERAEASDREQLARLAGTDALTGCLNYGAFSERLEAEVGRVERDGQLLGLVVVDRFKEFNDTRGHQAGDDALAVLGARLREATRRSDSVARVGGDEFALILPGASSALVAETAQRLVTLVERDGMGFTISAGAASIDAAEPTVRRLYADADAALYRAKDLGRGRAVAAGRSRCG